MREICTKTGDGGETGLRGGVRVKKDDIRIETNGQIDHLNALLGIVRAKYSGERRCPRLLADIQRELMVVMSHIATPEGMVNTRVLHVAEQTAEMEQFIASRQGPACFVIPGDGELSAFLHLARTQARTVERRMWTLHREYPLDTDILRWMNRLSDYLFVLATEER